MDLREIVMPITKPETEWVRGRALQKVSPTYSHGRLQALIATAITEWAERENAGRVATEWRFRVTPPGAATRPLVPDVAFLAYETLPADAPFEVVEVPLAAPTVAVEILSPGDRRADLDDKIRTYLVSGSSAVIAVDPKERTIEVNDRDGIRALREGDSLAHPSLPRFTLDLTALFARAAR